MSQKQDNHHMFMRSLFSAFFWLVFASSAIAQSGPYADWNRDIKGGRDHPLVGRYEGSVIANYLQRDDAKIRILTRLPIRLAEPRLESPKNSWSVNNSLTVQGRMTQLVYRAPKGRTPLELFANYKQTFSGQNYELLLQCEALTCYPSTMASNSDLFMKRVLRVFLIENDEAMLKALRTTDGADSLRYAVFRRGTNIIAMTTFTTVENGGASYAWFQIVEGAPPAAKVPSATEMIGNLTRTGRQALYSIYFDTGQAVVKPESDPTLREIAALLNNNPQLKLIVTGHTDNVGEFNANVGLSQRRAAAIVQKLIAEHQIASARLIPFGAGMAIPLANNLDEQGRTQNRRVELIRR
jgi:OmpA-OmpF porin, OOP family